MENAKIRVLVIDDSLFMRTLISDMLNSAPEIEVIGTAKDGEEGINKLSKIRPDCITLDLAMPGWDGLTTLEHIMAEHPTPVIILSAHSKKDADITIKCLNAGAVGFVLKPSGELSLDIKDVKHKLLEEVKAASRVEVGRIKLLAAKKPKRPRRKLAALNRIVVIGASTGGPQTLEGILYALPINFPVPVIIVQHMPSRFFTESLAEHLNKVTDLEVKVAENGEVLRPGKVYLAPAQSQLTLKSSLANSVEPIADSKKDLNAIRYPLNTKERNTDIFISLSEAEHGSLSPSVDITMKSVVKIYNGNVVGIILSGMGHDGQEGMKAIKDSGGKTIVQDESSLIFGMPKAVIDAGCADKIMPAGNIAGAMEKLLET